MNSPEHDPIDAYLEGEIIDPINYDSLAMEKFYEYLGDNDEN